jgi:hypothetical protein
VVGPGVSGKIEQGGQTVHVGCHHPRPVAFRETGIRGAVDDFDRSSAQAAICRVIKSQVSLREISLKGAQSFHPIGTTEPPDKT